MTEQDLQWLASLFSNFTLRPFHPPLFATACGHEIHWSASLSTPFCAECSMSSVLTKYNIASQRLELAGGFWLYRSSRSKDWNQARIGFELASKALEAATRRNEARQQKEEKLEAIHQAWEWLTDFEYVNTTDPEVLDALINLPHCLACASLRVGNSLEEEDGADEENVGSTVGPTAEHCMAQNNEIAWWERTVTAGTGSTKPERIHTTVSVHKSLEANEKRRCGIRSILSNRPESPRKIEAMYRRKHNVSDSYRIDTTAFQEPRSFYQAKLLYQEAQTQKAKQARNKRGGRLRRLPGKSRLSLSENLDETPEELKVPNSDNIRNLEQRRSAEGRA